ncbi:MAG: nucleotide exchange factor GrpE [Vicinamibacterales bacterium]|nr:nucleotide exchange factor GrpE [Vicinamibacterales bacterium]
MHDEHPTDQSKSPPQTSEPPDTATPRDETAPNEGGSPPEDAGDPIPPAGDATGGDDIAAIRRVRYEQYQRLIFTTAEFDNYRKRTDRERRERAEYAAVDLLTDLLPIVDDLERALAAETEDAEVYRRGVEIIHKQLLDLLDRRGVTPIETVGTDFDPNIHQAVTQEASDSHRDGEVIEELRRGYTLRERLLRAAMVKVAQA